MTLDEFFKTMRGWKAVAYNNEDYIEMEDGKCIIKSQKDDSTIGPLFNIVVSSKCIQTNEIKYRLYEKPILTKTECEYLTGVLKPFKKQFKNIAVMKCDDFGDEFINIIFKNPVLSKRKKSTSMILSVCFPNMRRFWLRS